MEGFEGFQSLCGGERGGGEEWMSGEAYECKSACMSEGGNKGRCWHVITITYGRSSC